MIIVTENLLNKREIWSFLNKPINKLIIIKEKIVKLWELEERTYQGKGVQYSQLQ